MSEQSGPFHRLGQPGGPGCKVVTAELKLVRADRQSSDGYLFDAGVGPTEIELLRTVAHATGIRWGKDDFGWWAAVPAGKLDDSAFTMDSTEAIWSVLRQDDNGNSFEVARNVTRDAGEKVIRQFEISGHKQAYSLVRSETLDQSGRPGSEF